MSLLRPSVVVTLLLAVLASGCLDAPQRFPVDFVNNSHEAVVFRVVLANQDGGWSTDDNWTVESGQSYQREWTLTTHDFYDLRVSVGDVSVTDDIRACAIQSMRFEWDGSRIDFVNLQGDGWAGC